MPKISKTLSLTLCLMTLLLSSCQSENSIHSTDFLAFGTIINLTIAGVTAQQAEFATRKIEKDFQQMHHAWHAWNPGPLGYVNQQIANNQTFAAPPSVIPLIQQSIKLYKKSEGYFNPAIGHLISIWGFHNSNPQKNQTPTQQQIQTYLTNPPKMTDLSLNGIMLSTSNSSVKLDFGAFAKGYGIALAMQHLKEMGIQHAILNAGGDIESLGMKNGEKWHIAVKDPFKKGALGSIRLNPAESIFTSGTYERKYTANKQNIHHIINPKTGLPASGIISVTVIGTDSGLADAAATAILAAGTHDWLRITQRMGIQYVLMIDEHQQLHMNPAMQKRLTLHHSTYPVLITRPLPTQ